MFRNCVLEVELISRSLCDLILVKCFDMTALLSFSKIYHLNDLPSLDGTPSALEASRNVAKEEIEIWFNFSPFFVTVSNSSSCVPFQIRRRRREKKTFNLIQLRAWKSRNPCSTLMWIMLRMIRKSHFVRDIQKHVSFVDFLNAVQFFSEREKEKKSAHKYLNI